MVKRNVCPWWVGYFLVSPIRRLWQDPVRILSPHAHPGMIALEPGPGMGFFTLELARLVGPSGRVVAVDVQPRMIEKLKTRARKAGLLDRIDARVVPVASMVLDDLDRTIDFAFAFAVVHELPEPDTFFREAARAMKSGATLLLAEPAGDVSEAEFAEQLAAAAEHGLKIVERLSLSGCVTALLSKS
jgi:ubiquinone/menaquinone biosynthesis C-methylase UbiE